MNVTNVEYLLLYLSTRTRTNAELEDYNRQRWIRGSSKKAKLTEIREK